MRAIGNEFGSLRDAGVSTFETPPRIVGAHRIAPTRGYRRDDVSGILDLIQCYWGKAYKSAEVDAGLPAWHPLVLHCLDVAAVADSLMSARPRWLARVAAALRLPVEDARKLLLWLVVLHDLGKFAGNFQIRVPALAAKFGLSPSDYGCRERHDAVGLAMVLELLPTLHEKTVSRISGVLAEPELLVLLSATTGHHGAPRSTHRVYSQESWNAAQLSDVHRFALDMWTFFDAGSIARTDGEPTDDNEFNAASWDIAGLTIAADWLGSNTDWFPYASTDASQSDARRIPVTPDELDDYWHDARRRSATAVVDSGLCRGASSTFDVHHVVPRPYALRPAQRATAELAPPTGGSLTIIEDQTGSGKTEAALILLHRLMAEDRVDGSFIGLPTQATTNALYKRALDILPQLVLDPAAASAVLSHSARDYNDAFRRQLAGPSRAELMLVGEQEPASIGYTAWLAESNKRALLAQFGVGTVDQSLLAILRSKHQALRLFGLDGKLLIVDEVHAYDSYQAQVLCTLLTRIAARGGHVVLLSATLPMAQRQQFVDAFARGLRKRRSLSRNVDASVSRSDYPLLTRLDAAGLAEIAVPPSQRPHAYRICYLSQIDSVIQRVVAAAEAGHAVAWIRNSVREACDAFERLHDRLPEPLREKMELFHARFTLGDRSRIEARVLGNFGPGSTAETRRGRIVIATQVIEQSLDVDFDVMVSDLAPIDLLIQRAGRLFRHRRDTAGNRVDGEDQRGEPELIVFGPDREMAIEANWISAWSRASALVYENHAYLWRTAQQLRDGLDLGKSPRGAIEAVYDAGVDDYPKVLQRAAFNAEGKAQGQRQVAGFNTLGENDAYECAGLAWPDDMTAPTRLGEPTLDMVLARIVDGKIAPWDEHPDDGWAMSVVRVRKGALTQRSALGAFEALALELEAKIPVLRWRVLLVLNDIDEGHEGMLETADGKKERFRYHQKIGLRQLQATGESQ